MFNSVNRHITFFLVFLFFWYVAAAFVGTACAQERVHPVAPPPIQQGLEDPRIAPDTSYKAWEVKKAPKLSFWKADGSLTFTFQTVGLENWAEGGEGAISLGTNFTYNINRETSKTQWLNGIRFDYGFVRQGSVQEFRKADDRLVLHTQYSARLHERWNVSGFARCTTQVSQGFNYAPDPNEPDRDRATLISNILSPGLFSSSFGVEYRVKSAEKKTLFSGMFSPIAGKLTTVLSDTLSKKGSFGVAAGEKMRSELGLNLHSSFQTTVMQNVRFENELNLFANYMTLTAVDVNWEQQIVMRVNKFLTTRIASRMIYDEDILIGRDDGTRAPAVQFRYVVNIGVGFIL